MTTETLRIMAGLENRLKTLLKLEAEACGHDAEIRRCDRQ
jgi:hypothetical protein